MSLTQLGTDSLWQDSSAEQVLLQKQSKKAAKPETTASKKNAHKSTATAEMKFKKDAEANKVVKSKAPSAPKKATAKPTKATTATAPAAKKAAAPAAKKAAAPAAKTLA